MTLINPDTRLCDVIEQEPSVIPVINRFGIRLGTSDRTVGETCAMLGLDADFVVAMLNTFINESYFPEDTLKAFRPTEIADYLAKTNVYYVRFQLPNIARHFDRLTASASGDSAPLQLMRQFFDGLKTDMMRRADLDRDSWFPALASGADAMEAVTPAALDDEIADKISDLKSMFIKHLTGDFDENLCYGVIVALNTLEKDVRQNNRIRRRILLPLSQNSASCR